VVFDFIWHFRGSVVLDAATTNQMALGRLEQLLVKQRKQVSERGPDHLAFVDPIWRNLFGPNWLAMLIYDRGRFWIDGGSLHYDLRSLHTLVFCLFAATVAFFFGLAVDGLASGLNFAAPAFAWLYGGNVLLALARVPFSIRNAVSRV
jgi:hypothetical protein